MRSTLSKVIMSFRKYVRMFSKKNFQEFIDTGRVEHELSRVEHELSRVEHELKSLIKYENENGLTNIINLDEETILVRMKWGGWVAVDNQNIDQLVGLVVNKQWEPSTTAVMLKNLKRGGVSINIGTSFGYYASLLGVFGGPNSINYCIEANPFMIPYLIKTCYWSGVIDQVRILNRAISDVKDKDLELLYMRQFTAGISKSFRTTKQVFKDLSESSWTHKSVKFLEDRDGFIDTGTSLQTKFIVKSTTVDSFIPNNTAVNVLKMDVEGMESLAILGAKATIQNSPEITIILEHSSNVFTSATESEKTVIKQAWDFLSNEGFYCWKIMPLEDFSEQILLEQIPSWKVWTETSHGDFVFRRGSIQT
jgi:FkbM family methyltransferase